MAKVIAKKVIYHFSDVHVISYISSFLTHLDDGYAAPLRLKYNATSRVPLLFVTKWAERERKKVGYPGHTHSWHRDDALSVHREKERERSHAHAGKTETAVLFFSLRKRRPRKKRITVRAADGKCYSLVPLSTSELLEWKTERKKTARCRYCGLVIMLPYHHHHHGS